MSELHTHTYAYTPTYSLQPLSHIFYRQHSIYLFLLYIVTPSLACSFSHTQTHTFISMWCCVIAGSIAVLFLQDHLASEANALTATTSLGYYHSPALSYSLPLSLGLHLPFSFNPSFTPSFSLSLSSLYIIRTVPLCSLFLLSLLPSYSQYFHTELSTFPLMLSSFILQYSFILTALSVC